MPKKITKRETKRSAPYNLRASTSIAPTSMATAIASPVTPWTPHHSQQMWSDPHMAFQHPMMQSFNMPLQAPLPQHQPQPQHQQQQHQPQHPAQHPAQHHPGQSAPWTLEEDELLMDAKGSGLGWNEIHHKCFPNKSGNACRKRHERLMVKLRTTDWDDHRIRRVMAEYNGPGVRQEFWSQIARRLGERWEDVERVCFQQGLKGLRTTNHASSHSRGRSRGSSGLGAVSEYEHTSSHGEYEQPKFPDQDDSGIDLGAPGPSRRTSQVMNPTIPGIEQVMRQPSGGYEYR